MVNEDFQLIYANPTFLNFDEVSGEEKKLNESVFIAGFDEDYIVKWKNYYYRALKGESFHIEEHFNYPVSNIIRYNRVTFEPLIREDQKIFAVSCQSKDISGSIKQLSEVNQLIDASLDVFCTINELGYFMYVSIAAINHWGYSQKS
jgi:PAS domain-containing protein